MDLLGVTVVQDSLQCSRQLRICDHGCEPSHLVILDKVDSQIVFHNLSMRQRHRAGADIHNLLPTC